MFLFISQQLYSVHLADQTEDCTVQLADHIKVPLVLFLLFTKAIDHLGRMVEKLTSE